MKKADVPLEKVCLLDPKAPQELSPEDGDGRFVWFLFGVSFPSRSISCSYYLTIDHVANLRVSWVIFP